MGEYNREKTVAALILAAGRSSRLQCEDESHHKLLLPLGEGTILSHVVDAALASKAHPIILILGYQSAQIHASLTRAGLVSALTDGIIIIENTGYAQGMSTSLHKGIQSLLNQNDQGKHPGPLCDGALILLGDQPLITPALLNQLIEIKYTTGKRIIAPFYNGQRRNPVLFDADLFPELLAITGDEGARSLIVKHQTEIGMLNIDDPQLCYDVDTWDAYEKVLHAWKQLH